MRVLIAGAGGFVGRHLPEAIRRVCGDDTEIIATGRPGVETEKVLRLDLEDGDAVRSALNRLAPTHVINLAGIAAPAAAARDPDAAWRIHCDAVRRLGSMLLETLPETVLVNAGTGLVYGRSFKDGAALDEDAAVLPMDDYAASKAAGDMALLALAARGLRCVLMRPFNHAGPGQGPDFVLPAFAGQIAAIEAGRGAPVLRVGNLDAERDFVDVRDVCDAYARTLLASGKLAPGTVLNVASGVARRIGDLLDGLLRLSEVQIRVEQDASRLRPSDVPRVVGDAHRARELLGWTPTIGIEETLKSILADMRIRVAAGETVGGQGAGR